MHILETIFNENFFGPFLVNDLSIKRTKIVEKSLIKPVLSAEPKNTINIEIRTKRFTVYILVFGREKNI